MRYTIQNLVCGTDGLGYCCLNLFYSRYKSSTLIAARLGVSVRAVEYGLNTFRKGGYKCQESEKCMIRIARFPRPIAQLVDCSASDQTDPQKAPVVVVKE